MWRVVCGSGVGMLGASVSGGVELTGRDYVRQSIIDCLSTRVGSRVMRPSYGSRLFYLLGRVMSEDVRAEAVGAIIEGVINGVAGVVPRRVVIVEFGAGRCVFDFEYVDEATGEGVTLEGIEVAVGSDGVEAAVESDDLSR